MRPDWYDIKLVCTTDPGGRYSYWWWFILGQFDPDFTVDMLVISNTGNIPKFEEWFKMNEST